MQPDKGSHEDHELSPMKSRFHPWRFLFSVLQLSLLTTAVASGSSAAADETTYRRALEAIDGQDWTGAARLLRLVIQDDPKSRIELTGGPIGKETAYLPHFYLGLATYRMGDCLRAPEHWRVAEEYSVIQQSPRFDEMQRLKNECESRFLDFAKKSAERALSKSEQYLLLLSEQSSDAGLRDLWRRNPDWDRSTALKREELQTVRADLKKAMNDQDPRAMTEAEGQAAELLRELRDFSEQVVAEAEQEANRAKVPSNEVVTSPRQKTGQQSNQQPPELSGSVSRALESAIRAYFRSDYSETLRILSRESFTKNSDAAQARLFEAAAHFALYRLGGSAEQSELEAAASAIAAGLEADALLEPETALFSPPFRSFFKERKALFQP